MKIICIHLKIFLCIFALLIILGIITVTPCAMGQTDSFLGRCYGLDQARAKELCSLTKSKLCSLCTKK